MSEDVRLSSGVIGPNAILQILPVLDQVVGRARRKEICEQAGLTTVPDGTQMVPEHHAARLHAQIRQQEPVLAPLITQRAGRATARYILAHRIPRPVQTLLKVSPARVSARLLSQAIQKNAWTFAGSGQFHVIDPYRFEIIDNPLIAGERASRCLCDWHAAVFSHLYSQLVAPGLVCEEVTCAAQGGRRCLFQIGLKTQKAVAEDHAAFTKTSVEITP